MFKKIVSDPLLHFIVISILFFVGYSMLNPASSDKQTILVSEGRVAQIKNSFVTQWKREPFPKELDDAIYSFAINEMYLLEARSLKLDVGDNVINRRLRQKMTFLLNDLAASKEPSEDELTSFYQDNSDKYRAPAQYGFQQVFISSDRTEKEVELLVALQQQRIQQGFAPKGDHSLLPGEVRLGNEIQLDRKFGENFSLSLASLELNQWTGPIRSAYGQHFIFLKTRQATKIKPFEVVRASVIDDWQYQNSNAYQKQYEQSLLDIYRIDREKPQAGELSQ